MAFVGKLGAVLIVGGIAAAAVGIAFAVRKRPGELGRPRHGVKAVGRRRAGGMTLTHYRDRSMPIKKRVGILQELTWQSIHDPRMRQLALAITKDCPARDGACEARAIDGWIRRNVRYTGDVAPLKMGRRGPVEGVDLFQSAFRTMEFGGGDCDDHAVMAATLLTLNGITARFRVTARSKDQPFSHIYTVAGLPKLTPEKWVALDTTLPGEKFGIEAPSGKKADFPA